MSLVQGDGGRESRPGFCGHRRRLIVNLQFAMSSEPPTLSYGRVARRRRWVVWIVLLVIASFAGLYLTQGKVFFQWAADRQRVNHVLGVQRPGGMLVLSQPSDVDTPNIRVLLDKFSTRLRGWLGGMVSAEADLRNMTRPQQTQRPGDPGMVAIQRLRTPKGDVRLMALGVNVMVLNDRSMAILECHVELFEIGGFFHPHFRELQVNPSTGGDFTGSASAGKWIHFEPIRYRPGSAIQFGPAAVSPTDPSTLRWPTTVNDRADVMLFTLDENDIVHLKMESGAALPLKVDLGIPASSPATPAVRGGATRGGG